MTTSTGHDTGRTMNGGTQGDDKLGQAASNLADQASRTAEAKASSTMQKASDTLQQFAEAVRGAGDGMREQQPAIAGAADTAAQRVEEFSSYLREHDAREVLETVQREARRQPALVIGGGLALGLLVGRFLRSGSPGNEQRSGADRFALGSGPQSYARDAYGYERTSTTGYVGGTGMPGSALGSTADADTMSELTGADTTTLPTDLDAARDADTPPGERDAFATDTESDRQG
jgi:hypothetical protein